MDLLGIKVLSQLEIQHEIGFMKGLLAVFLSAKVNFCLVYISLIESILIERHVHRSTLN